MEKPNMNCRLWWLILIVTTVVIPAMGRAAAPHDPFILARIPVERPGDLERLGHMALDIVRVEPGRYVEIVTHDDQAEQLRALGFEVQVIIADMEAHYARGRKGHNFGPFHTYSETVAELDAVHAAYPDITAEKISLGTTHEGRDIWAIKVSDHPELQEDEPEVLFDGLHHAREVITVEVVLNTLNHLCQNYGTDPDITFLVDHRQIWFVPIVNPDGFVYNETNWPDGGGMWRKNRRNNGGGSYGVDLNRNYPYQWGGVGSSGDPDGETYRGPYAGSEPEVQAMMGFIESHQFVTHQSYHSYAELILIPWAYTAAHTADDSLFRVIGNEMVRDSGYDVGQAGEVLYYCSGVTTDWSYGDTTAKPKALAFTTEVGGSGFWPFASELDGLVRENLHSDLYLIQAAGCFPSLEAYVVRDSAGNDRIDPGELVTLTIMLSNDSPVVSASDVMTTLRTDDAYVQMVNAQSSMGDIGTDAQADNSADPFCFLVEASCPQWRRVHLTLEIDASGGEVHREYPLSFRVGQPTVLYENDFEISSDWIQDSSHTAVSGAFVRIDPNPTPYQPGDDTTPDPGIYALVTGQNSNPGEEDVDGGVSAIRSPVLDLTTSAGAELALMYFFGQRDEGDDPEGDFFRIDVSNDGGTTYPVNLVSYGDEAVSAVWRSLEVDLDEQLALTDQICLRVQVSEGPSAGDLIEGGIDDVLIAAGTDNAPPPSPVPLAPSAGDTVWAWTPTLTVENVADPDGGPVTYGYRLYADSLLTDLIASVDGIAPGAGTTSWTVDPPPATDATYWWRALAADSAEPGSFSPPSDFHFLSTGPPPVSDLTIQKVNNGVALMWSPVAGAESYVVYRDSVAGFEAGPEDSVSATADIFWMDGDEMGEAYYLVRAVDADGRKSVASQQVGQFQKGLEIPE
jgi:hypothetical protein